MIDRMLSTLSESIEELEGAKEYIKEALILKENGHTDMSKTYYNLSSEEIKHASILKELSTEIKNHVQHDSLSPKLISYVDMLNEKYKEELMKVKLCILMYEEKI